MDNGEDMGILTVKNKCCCCGGTVLASYMEGDDMGKSFAEATDVCTDCFIAGCRVLTGEKCEVTGKRQVQLNGEDK